MSSSAPKFHSSSPTFSNSYITTDNQTHVYIIFTLN